jgi:hypothetical protein
MGHRGEQEAEYGSNDLGHRSPALYQTLMTFEESALRTSALCTSGSGTFTDDLLGRKRFPRHFPGPFCFSLYPTGTEIPAQVNLQLVLVHLRSDGDQHEPEWVQDSRHSLAHYRET